MILVLELFTVSLTEGTSPYSSVPLAASSCRPYDGRWRKGAFEGRANPSELRSGPPTTRVKRNHLSFRAPTPLTLVHSDVLNVPVYVC